MKKNILVFPCGSEIGLEIYRSLQYSTHFNLIGASSASDHGEFIFEKYIGNLPYYNDENIYKVLNEIIEKHSIDAIYPTMDSVINELSANKEKINCKIIAPESSTTEICLNKSKTYHLFNNIIPTPKIYNSIDDITKYPVFIKPIIGYGARGTAKIDTKEQGIQHLEKYPNSIIMEYLSGEEYTIDCFTNKKGKLLFVGPRQRKRIMNGISVNTVPIYAEDNEFKDIAEKINTKLNLRGAWFFQMKKDNNNNPFLLEIASRLGGSSALFRNMGVNFAMLTLFDAFDLDVNIFTNDYEIVLDRALDNKYKINIDFSTVYIDFDDCLILDNHKVNTDLIKLIYQFINENKKIILITKHDGDINKSLLKYRLTHLFDEIIHIKSEDFKYKYIKNLDAIFIDDSHIERKEIHENLKIPVFAPNNIESLLK